MGRPKSPKKRWYYRFPGTFHANGPTMKGFRKKEEVRKHLRNTFGYTRLPKGFEVWPAGGKTRR